MLHDEHHQKQAKKNARGRMLMLCLQISFTLVLGCYSDRNANAEPVSHSAMEKCNPDTPRPDRAEGLREQILSSPNGSIAYYRFGHGSPVVLITGYRATISEWNAGFLGALAAEHELIIYDNRGAGNSVSGKEHFDVKDLASDTTLLISSLGLRDVTVIGWSMGGIVAQQLALGQAPGLARLVLINTMAPGRGDLAPPVSVISAMAGEGPSHFSTVMRLLFPAAAVRREEKCFRHDMFLPDDYPSRPVQAAAAREQEIIMERWSENQNAYRELKKISIPVLLLTGRDDAVISPDNSSVLHRIIPQASLIRYNNAGHAMMYQYPRQLADQINRFIISGDLH